MSSRAWTVAGGIFLAEFAGTFAPPAEAQLQWTSKDEKNSFKIGFLSQLQGEVADVAGTDDTATNLFFRRLRIMMAFDLGEKLSIFMQTDSPNLGKSNNAGDKDFGDIYIQDFVATWKFSQAFQLDGGMLFLEQSYNHNQSAGSLLTLDYGPYTYVESGPTDSRVGRDYGVRARGYLAGDHLEYRAGVYQGVRGENASNELRYGGRLMYSFFTPQVGLFYRGPSLGKIQTLSIGASYETQEGYDSFGLDAFYDQPWGEGNGFTAQVDCVSLDGGTFLTALPEQTNLLLEAGVYFSSIRLLPFVQYAEQNFDDPALVDEEKLTAGLAYHYSGHNNNLKLSYARIEPAVGPSRDQFNLQWQVLQF